MMNARAKSKVYKVYEKMVGQFDDTRTKSLMESLIVNLLLTNATILHLGCGIGQVIAKFFINKGFKVTGIDGSKKMIVRFK